METQLTGEYYAESLYSIFKIENLRFYPIEGETGQIPHVRITFEDSEKATYFKKHIIEKRPTEFEDVTIENDTLEFNLSVEFVKKYFEIAMKPYPPIAWSLIEKYGGSEELKTLLWEFAEEETIDMPKE